MNDRTPDDAGFADSARWDSGGEHPGARRFIAFALAALLVASLAFVTARRLAAPSAEAPAPDAFAQAVDLSALGRAAVHYQGRLKSYDSFAYSMVRQVSGPRPLFGQSPGFTYLDMLLRPARYSAAPVIFVKSKPIRAAIAGRLEGDGWTGAQARAFVRRGMIAPPDIIANDRVRERLIELSRDAVKSKFVEQIEGALHVMQPGVLADKLRLLPPATGDASTAWLSVSALTADGAAGADHDHENAEPGHTHEPIPGVGALAGMDESTGAALIGAWKDLTTAWRAEDAPGVNAAAAALASALPRANPALYPAQERLAWEARYFRWGNMTWVWLVYLLAAVFLLMGVVYRWRWAAVAGTLVFCAAFGLQTFALGVRWYASGRWPNANMFEAVTTAAWFGGACALLIEPLARRGAMRGMFFLCSAAASATAFMAAHFLPVQLNPDISNKMPVLHDVWLYIHTNVIIFSYCLIAMAAVTSALYLLHRLGGGAPAHARAGGAGMLMASGATGGGRAAGARTFSFAEALDGATMTLMELSFILLFTGTIMGAIWADHSWGRPWGWDPKEVFALATFLVYAVLIHVRIKVRDKGLWTAVLAIIGAGVMIFNWTVINFVITGLHSYA